jgi:hypothetical protein
MAAWTNIPSPGVHTAGFLKDAAISAMALNAAIKGSILAEPEACLVMMMAYLVVRSGRWPQPRPSGADARGVGFDQIAAFIDCLALQGLLRSAGG